MVGLGLVSVYELIRGSVSAYPALCIRALEALLDILQGQQPDALRNEPQEVIGECSGTILPQIYNKNLLILIPLL